MKGYLCIVVVLCGLVLVKCETSEEMTKLLQECKKEIGLSEPEGPSNISPKFDDQKMKCFHACLMKKKDRIVDGKIVAEKAIEMAAKHMPGGVTDVVKADINECATKANEEKDECAVAGSFHKCMVEKHSKKQ